MEIKYAQDYIAYEPETANQFVFRYYGQCVDGKYCFAFEMESGYRMEYFPKKIWEFNKNLVIVGVL